MKEYLNSKFDFSSPELVSVYDELPLWSSYFGAVLLDQVPLKKNSVILDIGCGTGFPLIEIAQRSGNTCKVFGIDPWDAAIKRIEQKLQVMNVNNVKIIEGNAESLPFENNYFDLIVSNNGINNVTDSGKVMKESIRVLKENGTLVFSVNLPETMKEFYDLFRQILYKLKLNNELQLLENHIFSKRKSLAMNIDMITRSGFTIDNIVTDKFFMRFIDGTAMLNYYFIRLAFLESWQNLVPLYIREKFFNQLESELNIIAKKEGEVRLTIPFACFTCRKS